jgi:hypothetical protein
MTIRLLILTPAQQAQLAIIAAHVHLTTKETQR